VRRRHSLGVGRWRLDSGDWRLWSRVEKLGLLGWITGLFSWIGYPSSITEEPNKILVYSNYEPNVRPRTKISVQSGSVFGLGFFCPGLRLSKTPSGTGAQVDALTERSSAIELSAQGTCCRSRAVKSFSSFLTRRRYAASLGSLQLHSPRT
jgi:hypothetical protein